MSWSLVIWIGAAALCGSLAHSLPAQPDPTAAEHQSALLGAKECTFGPSYWCTNFTTAGQCNANRHCIRTVWEHTVPPPDNGEICETCKKMVEQAREELRSNETQENIKLVLEGSCLILIPIKPIAHECVKLVDQAIPQLIEALSSQMNPQMVCATAGLCNSARLENMLAMYKANAGKPKLDCDNCAVVAGMAEKNFRAASRDQVLNSLLEVCGNLGSYSDGCAATIIVHFNSLYESLAASLYPQGVCHLAGVCRERYHNHSKAVEVRPVPQLEGDMPCELCEQLVQHLRDILVANTTEKEFEQVLLGICGATRGFKTECVDMVETYYPAVYSFLTEELDGKVICTQIGICPKTDFAVRPLNPLLPVEILNTLQYDQTSSVHKAPSDKPAGLHRVPLVSSGVSVHSGSHSLQVSEAQLPLDSLVVVPGDKDLCQMCNYFLHFLQDELTNPINEQILVKKAEQACDGLPVKFSPMCRSFVDTYAQAVIALLAQDIDPSQICPKIGVCPGLLEAPFECDLCKTTAVQLTNYIAGSNTSEPNLKKQLMMLCLSLPFDESQDCSRLLYTHREDLLDMLTAEFTGEEMCFYMQYCKATPSPQAVVGGDFSTNEIPSADKDEKVDSETCVLCEFVLKTLEKDLQNNKTEAQIREAIEHVCFVMPSTIRPKCKQFVDQYCDLIVTLLAQSINPNQICQMLGICPSTGVNMNYIKKSMTKCVVCESLMGALQGVIEDRDVEKNMNRNLEIACLRLPHSMRRECQDIVRQLAPQIEVILGEVPIGPLVCRRLQLCGQSQSVDFVSRGRCEEGQAYWCMSTMHAATCQKIEYCQKNVWFADKPSKKSKVHAKRFLF